MSLENLALSYEHFTRIEKKIRFNDTISAFYNQMFDDTNDLTFQNRARSVDLCSKYLDIDYYRLQGVKCIKRINLCKDRFCQNCQSLLAQQRELKYTPILDEYAKDFDLYHVVFTVPNCDSDALLPMLKLMYKKFGYMVRYFKGQKKIKHINFRKYGFQGAIRALEITQNPDDRTYHPHFHCVFIMKKGLVLDKSYVNQYSYKGSKLERKFSELEILMQKVWFLLITGQEVNYDSIKTCGQGYSVIVDPADGNYHQVFKYAIKGCFQDDHIFDYDTFKTLYAALHSRRIIQAYGVLHNIDFEADEILDDQTDAEYDQIITELERVEKPVFIAETLNVVMLETLRANVRYISKANLKAILARGDPGSKSDAPAQACAVSWACSYVVE